MLNQSFWSDWDRPQCYPYDCTCEALIDGWFVQPSATLTSIPLFLIGIYVFLKFRTINKKLGHLGLILSFVGGSSFFAHASFSAVVFYFDFFSILMVFSWIIFYFQSNHTDIYWWIKLLFLSLSIFILIFIFEKYRVYICLTYFLFVCSYFYSRKNQIDLDLNLLYVSLLFFIISFVFNMLDEHKIWCNNNIGNTIHGHSIWHIGVTIASYFFVKSISRT